METMLNVASQSTKTMHLAGRARRLLPVVAPTFGVTGLDWGSQFLEARATSTLRGW